MKAVQSREETGCPIQKSLFEMPINCLKKRHSNEDHALRSHWRDIERWLTARIGIRQPAIGMLVVII